MTHERDHIESALAQHTDDYRVLRELHRVPPHTTWDVTFQGRRAVCKRATSAEGDPATEGAVLAFVRRHTDLPVPEVLAVGRDHFIAAWLDGVPGEEPREDVAWARAAGDTMARLHDATAGTFDATGFPQPSRTLDLEADDPLVIDGHASWAETVAAVLDDRREFLDARGHDDYAGVADEATAFVRTHPEAFPDPPEAVLCHGNLLPDHLGISDTDGAAPTALFDFEHAVVGHPAYDYWRTALPAFEARERPSCERAFRAGYTSVRPLPDGIERHADCYRLVNTVSYLRSLFLQDQHPPDEARRRAEWMADHVRTTLADLRGRYG